ncbi:IS66 family insertion sequence element accessory protein TnpA [Mordavella massiliensis]|uniref:IS66 family insertion sequence element accessory protein TnpA n=2 Tax=Bacillota TaxID=1239 RepID=UPI003709601E
MLVSLSHEIITPENYKFFKGVSAIDKITHQVRAEHWTKILNECMNSGMPKTACCRANGISGKQFFYWQRILRWEAYEASQNPSLSAVIETGQLSTVQQSVSFAEIKLPAVLPDASSVFHPDSGRFTKG